MGTGLISESTYKYVKDTFFCRLVDKVSVKGRSAETLLYEPLGQIDSPDAIILREKAEDTETILNTFFDQKYDEVLSKAKLFLEKFPSDNVVERAVNCAKLHI